ncbi:MAG: hypothetical protein JO100_07960 [Pseudonocardia sp.]|nr:hypothetical protein [Pseudonocardia sp.]
MAPVLVLTMGTPSALAAQHDLVADLDLYELPQTELKQARGLLVGPHVDQVFLSQYETKLDRFVHGGGRLVVCAQVALPFATGLTRFIPLTYRSVCDLTVHRLAAHPVWRGVAPEDLTFRRGVAGFYGRGFYPDPPRCAQVVHGLGPRRLPLDLVYPLGDGEVLLHGGNDLWGYADDDTTAARMTPQLLAWVLSEPPEKA